MPRPRTEARRQPACVKPDIRGGALPGTESPTRRGLAQQAVKNGGRLLAAHPLSFYVRTIMQRTPDMWVFAYGSLMWRPGFDFVEQRMGLLHGYRRALCVYSHVHRGSPERPGLVLGLERGGSCRGVAFRVAQDASEATLDYLRERELVTNVYQEKLLTVSLEDGSRIDAVAYVVDPEHHQYAGRLSLEDQLRHIRQGHGASGRNVDYVVSTSRHLDELGIDDPGLRWLTKMLRAS